MAQHDVLDVDVDLNNNRLAQFIFSAIYIFIPSLPVTHVLGLVAHSPHEAKAQHWLMYPLRGGKHHCIFQIISWVSTLLLLEIDVSAWEVGPSL